MPSTNPSPEPGDNPLAPLTALAQWLTGTTIHVAIGLIVGLLAARAMRREHLHWSWGAVGLTVVFVARQALGGLAWTVGTAALCATVRSRRWHREDVEAGADLAEIAAARRGPLDALRSLARRLPRCREMAGAQRRPLGADGRRPGGEEWWRADELIVGEDDRGRPVSIPLGGAGGGTHTLVVGAAGSGKTVTQTWIAVRAIEHGMGAVVVDPKNDPFMREQIARAAAVAGRRFVEWTPGGPSVYNPYARGSETEIADKALSGERFTEPHYLRQAQRYLGHEVRALRRAGLEVSLAALVEHLDPGRLEVLARGLPPELAQATHDYLDSLTARQRSDLAGVRDRLAIMAESDVGRWLDPRTIGTERFDVLDAVKARAVVYFSLESDRRPLLAQMLGSAIVQDLQTTVAALQGRPIPSLVAIDEFSAVAAEQVARLFGRARAAGMSLLLGTQELSDLRLPGREALQEQVLGNLSALIAHRQVVPDSAELIASVAGTHGAWSTSRHSDGRGTRTRVRELLINPNDVKGLATGCAAVVVLSRGPQVRVARIFSPDRRR